MNGAACILNGARPAHVTVHLNLAVCQSTGIASTFEQMLLSPLDAIRTGGGVTFVNARSIALQRGISGLWAALLLVAAAPIFFGIRPVRALAIAVVRDASAVFPLTTPRLFGV